VYRCERERHTDGVDKIPRNGSDLIDFVFICEEMLSTDVKENGTRQSGLITTKWIRSD